ncbi:MAG: hypothetical protein ABIH90_00665 [Candidatus Aenigmatarchaeota archaeon]
MRGVVRVGGCELRDRRLKEDGMLQDYVSQRTVERGAGGHSLLLQWKRLGIAWWFGTIAMLLAFAYMLASSAGVSFSALFALSVLFWALFHIAAIVVWTNRWHESYGSVFFPVAYTSLMIVAFLSIGKDLGEPGYQWYYYAAFLVLWFALNALIGAVAASIELKRNFVRTDCTCGLLFRPYWTIALWLMGPPIVIWAGRSYGLELVSMTGAVLLLRSWTSRCSCWNP